MLGRGKVVEVVTKNKSPDARVEAAARREGGVEGCDIAGRWMSIK